MHTLSRTEKRRARKRAKASECELNGDLVNDVSIQNRTDTWQTSIRQRAEKIPSFKSKENKNDTEANRTVCSVQNSLCSIDHTHTHATNQTDICMHKGKKTDSIMCYTVGQFRWANFVRTHTLAR